MSPLEFEPWEPEESVGKIWHSLVSRLDAPEAFEDAAVTLDDMLGQLGIFFRGLGGGPDVELKAATSEETKHRLSWLRALGQSVDRSARPSFDGEILRLPSRVTAFSSRDANVGLYIWLAASAVFARSGKLESDPLRADIRALQAARAMTSATLSACPGLKAAHAALCNMTLQTRPVRRLPVYEAAIEGVIIELLGGSRSHDRLARALGEAVECDAAGLSDFSAPPKYHPFMSVPLWADIRPMAVRTLRQSANDEQQTSGAPPPDQEQRTIRANRKNADQAARKDSLVLHKFETILSFAEFLNINRRIDDDDADNAKKAADDLNEVSLAQVQQKARARLKLHLDLSPEEAEFERLAGVDVYPEWDHRAKRYMQDYCRVISGPAEPVVELPQFLSCPQTRRRIRSVRRQFEALRPKRMHLTRQIDGEDIDLEAAIEARVDLAATGEHSDRVYRSSRAQERDLAVSILLDASRSTESIVAADRCVLDVAREALIALAWGLDACGDETAINAFSSLRRQRVFMHACKGFDEGMGSAVEARIAGLRPGHYTRLGAAIRHVSKQLAVRPRQRRLLLILTDGKPNDLDHYEGRFGVEDSHMAVRDARRQGQSVFGVTIDSKSQATFSRIFGKSGFVVIPHADKLPEALPQLYRHLAGQ